MSEFLPQAFAGLNTTGAVLIVQVTPNIRLYKGSPVGVVAGQAGSPVLAPDLLWDYTNAKLYICTTAGVASAAVWTQFVAANSWSGSPASPPAIGTIAPNFGYFSNVLVNDLLIVGTLKANRVVLVGATTGNPAVVSALGTDTNIHLRLLPQGTGEVLFNLYSAIHHATYQCADTPAAVNKTILTATRPMRVRQINEVHSTAAGGVSTMIITKDTGTDAPGAGVSIFASGSFNLAAVANTVQYGTISADNAIISLAIGDRLAVKWNNAIQLSAGVTVNVGLAPI